MKLWLLTFPSKGWDVAHGFVVRADSEKQARELASKRCGDEGADTWLQYATCLPLSNKGPAEIILRDFLAG